MNKALLENYFILFYFFFMFFYYITLCWTKSTIIQNLLYLLSYQHEIFYLQLCYFPDIKLECEKIVQNYNFFS